MKTPRTKHELVLGIETGSEHISIGLLGLVPGAGLGGAVVLDSLIMRRDDPREDSVLRSVDAVLSRHGKGPSDLVLIAVGRGPGSFTGIRVGLSVALGLSLGSGVAAWPVCSLGALALNANAPDRLVLALLDARKGEVYGGLFRLGIGAPEVVLAPRLGTCEAVTALAASTTIEVFGAGATPVVLGSGSVAYGVASALPPGAHVACGVMVAWLAAHEWSASGRDPSQAPALDAVYLRRPEAEIALESG